MVQRATQFDPDHARRNTEPIGNILLRQALKPRRDKDVADSLRQGLDSLLE